MSMRARTRPIARRRLLAGYAVRLSKLGETLAARQLRNPPWRADAVARLYIPFGP